MTEEKIFTWFETFNRKLEENNRIILGLRERIEELFNFIETHQTDIQLLKSSFRDHENRLNQMEKVVIR